MATPWRDPVSMAIPNEWSEEKANTIAHFLDVAQYLAHSPWKETKVSFGYTVKGGSLFQPTVLGPTGPAPGTVSPPTHFKRPDLYSLNAALVLIRQLFAKEDKLFEKACGDYIRHCPSQARQALVQMEKEQFDQVLKNEPMLFQHGCSGNDILRAFFYEFGLLHRPRTDQTDAFRELIQKQGKERTFFAFHFVLHSLTCHAWNAAQIVAIDFRHWITTEKHDGPTRVGFDELFRDDPSAKAQAPLGVGEAKVQLSIGATGLGR